MKKDSSTTINISNAAIVKIVLAVLAVVVFIKIWTVLASIVLAVIIAAALEPTVAWLEKNRIPRVVGVPGLYILGFGVLIGIFYVIIPSLFNEVFLLSKNLPDKYGPFLENLFQGDALEGLEFLVPALEEALISLQERIGGLVTNVIGFVSTIFGGLFSFFLVLIFSFYITLRKNSVENFVLTFTQKQHKEYINDLTRRVLRRTGRWLQAMVVLSSFMGVAVFIMLQLLGIRFAVTLGILGGILEIVPFIGPFIVGILIFVLASTESLALGIVAVGVYTLLQQLQQIFVMPTVMSRVAGLSPFFILLAVIAGGQIAGVWGVIIAVPLSIAIGEVLREIQKKKT